MSKLASTTQQWQESVLSSFLGMVRAPDGDFDALDQLIQAVSDEAGLQLTVDLLSSNTQGKRAFETRPRLGNIDLEQLHGLPDNTLGHAYADHMLRNGLKLLEAPEAYNDYTFLGVHIKETHDIWHVVTGCNTNILGEIQLEAFYVAQLQTSRFFTALLAKNLLKSVLHDIELVSQYMDAIAQGWLMGKQAKPLFGMAWNTLWETPLEEVRTTLNLAVI